MSDEGGFVQVGVLGILGVVFITLKVIGEITWPWIWVLCPFWIGIVIFIAMILFMVFMAAIFDKKARSFQHIF